MDVYFQKFEKSQKIFKGHLSHKGIFGCRQLTEKFWFCINGRIYTILPGFWWDGASIPKFAWSVIGCPWDDDVYPGALIHDMLFGANLFPRLICDEAFYSINRSNGMGWTKAQTIDKALYAGGYFAYQRTKEEIEGALKHLLVNGEPISYDTLINTPLTV